MKEKINIIKDFILNIIFPIECVKCGKENIIICDNCLPTLFFNKVDFISTDTSPDKLCIMGNFKNPHLKELIHLMKYKYVESIGNMLGIYVGNSLGKYFEESEINCHDILISTIPMHKRKYLERGFNQSELIGQSFARNQNIEICTDLLLKNKNTRSQMELKRSERLNNLKEAFIFNQSKKDDYKHIKKILLVDDIYTTGSTLSECAQVIKSSMDVEVWGVVVGKNM